MPTILHKAPLIALMAFCELALSTPAAAQDDANKSAELAKELQNPIASLISVPIQNNWDFGIGPANAMRYTLNIQPVIPFALSDDWNLISRTILPIIDAESPTVGGSNKFGLGDTLESLFLSPSRPTSSGLIWGAGPAVLLPTGTDGLSGHEWAAGPTVVLLKQDGPWTYGLLANHLWSVAGSGGASVNATFLNPWLSYTTKTSTTFSVQTEATYDWQQRQWTAPVSAVVGQVMNIGSQPIELSLGVRYYAEKPADGPDWGMFLQVTFLFPK